MPPNSGECGRPKNGCGASPRWRDRNILEAVFDQLSDAIVIYDRQHVIHGVNRAAEKMLGMAADELAGSECCAVFRGGDCEPECALQLGLTEPHGVRCGTLPIRARDGRERLAVVDATPLLDDDGQIEGAVATIKDVTAERDSCRSEAVAESPAMREVLRFVRRIAASEVKTILLEGENGCGKGLIAKTLHQQSFRHAGPFITIDCAAIPETLLEAEMFGYEKGAFTDARTSKPGIFELADKGTLFLDEVGEIPLTLQAKLLRVLEEQCFRRLGGLTDIQLDVRAIAATNRNIPQAVRQGKFRQDLYFRLNVIQIMIPPLRERIEDILPFADFFIAHCCRKYKRRIMGLSPEAQRLLLAHDWPGNVRELRNTIERAMVLEESDCVQPSSLGIEGAGRH